MTQDINTRPTRRETRWSTFEKGFANQDSSDLPVSRMQDGPLAAAEPGGAGIDGSISDTSKLAPPLEQARGRGSVADESFKTTSSKHIRKDSAGYEWVEFKDGKTYINTKLPDGRVKRLEITSDEWIEIIDGQTYAYRKLANDRVQRRKIHQTEAERQEDSGDDDDVQDAEQKRYMKLDIAGKKKLQEVRQTTYTDPGNPFASDDRVPELPPMPTAYPALFNHEADRPGSSSSTYSTDDPKKITPPAPGRGGSVDNSSEYVPPRANWHRRSSLPSVPRTRPAMKQSQTEADVRDTRFYGFYDDILGGSSKGKGRQI